MQWSNLTLEEFMEFYFPVHYVSRHSYKFEDLKEGEVFDVFEYKKSRYLIKYTVNDFADLNYITITKL